MQTNPIKNIAIVTGSRADYSLLRGLMSTIQQDTRFDLQILVTGTHLSPEFGLSHKIIEQDGFSITAKVESLVSSDTAVGIAKSIGLGIIGFADVFDRMSPDIVVILGDRFESFAAAQAAMTHRIPIAHIHGGESSEGLIDEAIRHSITKMSHIHFASTEQYKNRIIQLGENPDHVFNVGALGMDNISSTKLLPKQQFEDSIKFKLAKVNFLVTYHPVTLRNENPFSVMSQLLIALERLPDANILFTQANADTDGRQINMLIDKFVLNNPNRAISFTNLGTKRYLSAIKHCDIIIGNSSSGIIEAPCLKTPTVNIGIRQRGRLRTCTIIDSDVTTDSILTAIRKAMSQNFLAKFNSFVSPYGDGSTAKQIANILSDKSLNDIVLKQFFEINCNA